MGSNSRCTETLHSGAEIARPAGAACAIHELQRPERAKLALPGRVRLPAVLATIAVLTVGVVAEAASPPAKKTKAEPAAAAPAEAPAGETPAAAAKPTGKKDPAAAGRAIDNASKLIQTGKTEQAVQVLSSVVAGGGLPPAVMARALHQRGLAHRKAGRPAQAISDLSSALWLQGGLGDADRADAMAQRSAAYKEAGLVDPSAAAAAEPASSRAASRAQRTAEAPSNWPATATTATPVTTSALAPGGQPAAAAPVTNPIGNLFASMFGGGTAQKAAPAQPPRAVATPSAAPATPATSAWSSAVSPARTPAANTRTAALGTTATAAAAAAAPTPSGTIHARISLVRTEAEAKAVSDRLRREHAVALGARQPEVSQAQFGAMGTFFQVRIGPYANATEAQDVCKRIKASGLDCVPVDR